MEGADLAKMRDADLASIEEMVKVHLAAFPRHFLSRMGRDFLAVYYREMLEIPGGISLVHESTDIDGFVVGLPAARGFNRRFILRHPAIIAWAAVRALCVDAKVIARLSTRGRDVSHQPNDKETICLLSIAVAPISARTGVGSKLLEGFIARARGMSYRHVYLTTDRDGNDHVNGFYARHGFVKSGEYDSGNRRYMNEYTLELTL